MLITSGGYLFVIGLLVNLIGVFVFWRFDRMFKDRPNIADMGIPLIGIMARTFTYMGCVVFKNKSLKGKIWSVVFQGYDFHRNTNLFEKVLSHICVWGYVVGLCIGILGLLLKWLF